MENLLKDTIQERDDLAEDIAENEKKIKHLENNIYCSWKKNNKKG
jgi:hypothetical protein